MRACPAGRVAVSNPHAVTFEPGQNVCPEPARTRCGARHTGGSNVPNWWNGHSTMPQMPRDDEEERFDQRREDQVALQEQRLRRVSLDWLFSKDSQAERRMPARSLRRANTPNRIPRHPRLTDRRTHILAYNPELADSPKRRVPGGNQQSGGIKAKPRKPNVFNGFRGSNPGGGYEIRTREAVTPTRFPSVRHRPLGESSIACGNAPARVTGQLE